MNYQGGVPRAVPVFVLSPSQDRLHRRFVRRRAWRGAKSRGPNRSNDPSDAALATGAARSSTVVVEVLVVVKVLAPVVAFVQVLAGRGVDPRGAERL